MRAFGSSICKHATRSTPVTRGRVEQKRFAQVSDIRFIRRSHQNVTDKYREKLEEKRREQGLDSIDSLKEQYQDKIRELKKKATVPGMPETPSQASSHAPYQTPPPPQPQTQSAASEDAAAAKVGIKTLSSFVDVERMRELGPKEIEYLWRLRHVNDTSSLCAVVSSSTFSKLAATAKKHPQFILPLPREEQGAEIHFLQWTFPSTTTATVLFTHLAEFKLRGEFASPHTTVTFHKDLAEDKEVVLMNGNVLPDRGVSTEDGKFLLLSLQNFYGQESESSSRRKLMQQFTNGDATFSVDDLLSEAERLP